MNESLVIGIATELARSEFSLTENFLSEDEVSGLLSELEALKISGAFHSAAIGHQASLQVSSEIRQDETCWFEPEALRPAQSALWQRIERLKEALNRELYLGLWDVEAHFAVYQPAGFYRRHLDSFGTGNKRVLSMVIYLNRDWRSGDGGELKVILGGGVRLIEPRAGTMVCFLSEKIEHEVLEAKRERKSIAAWLRRR